MIGSGEIEMSEQTKEFGVHHWMRPLYLSATYSYASESSSNSSMSTYAIQVDETRDGEQHKSIVCLVCQRQSYHPGDVCMKYCANCNLMHEEQRERTITDVWAHQMIGRQYRQPIQDPIINWGRDGF